MKKKFTITILIHFAFFSYFLNAQTTNGLVMYLPFTGNANDASGNSNNGIAYNITLTTGVDGTANSAYAFNGTNSYIDVPNSPSLNPSSISLCAWVNAQDAPSHNPDIIRKSTYADASNEQYLLRMNTTNGYPQAGVKVGTNCAYGATNWNMCNPTTAVPLSAWHFLVATYDGITIKMYMDGILTDTVVSATPGPIMTCGSDLRIGLAWSNYPDYFQGVIDEVRIYNRAISACEVMDLYTTAIHPNAGLILYFPFTGNANDISGNVNNGNVYNALLTNGVDGTPNTAYAFDGISSYIEVPNSASLNPSYISLCAWINAQDAPSHNPDIIRKSTYADASNEQYLLRMNTTNRLPQAGVKVGSNCGYMGTNWNMCNPTTTVSLSAWHFLVATYDGITIKMYMDGILTDTVVSATPGPIMTCGSDLRIGLAWSNYPDYFQGAIDEVRIYNRAISACEVANLYASQSVNSPPQEGTTTANVSPAIINSSTCYPNPFTTTLGIAGDISFVSTYEIYSVSGNKVLSGVLNGKIDVSNLGSGMYIINTFDAQHTLLGTSKAIKL